MNKPVGRPRKDQSMYLDKSKDNENEPVDSNVEQKSESPIRLKVKVVSYGDYLLKARSLYPNDDAWTKAVELLYTEYDWPNKRIDVIDKKGDTRFVCQL